MNQNANNETDLEIVDDTQMQTVSILSSSGCGERNVGKYLYPDEEGIDLDLQAATSEERVEKAMQTTAVATSVIAQDTLERAISSVMEQTGKGVDTQWMVLNSFVSS